MDDIPLRAEFVEPNLSTRWLARPFRYLPQTHSTNEILKGLLAEGTAVHGMTVLADYQQKGRGRLGRTWQAPAGTSLLLSMLFSPDWPGEQAQWLTMIGAVAGAEAVQAVCGLHVGIKWPNDLMLNVAGRWHKVAGLLLDGFFDGNGRLCHAVLGMGINVNIAPADLPDAVTPPVSLMMAAGRPVSRYALLLSLLTRLEALYDLAATGTSPYALWQARLINLGQETAVTFPNGRVLRGKTIGTTPSGALLLQEPTGQVYTIAGGEVTLREK
ncbi:MAG: biotin--[acetyl-CoA-carboxylase] ligase [Candidatus Promineifilaceae bacterium]